MSISPPMTWPPPRYRTAAVAPFMAIIMMILCYSISDGIALGFITYGAVMLGSGKAKEVRPIIWILDIVFILYFII